MIGECVVQTIGWDLDSPEVGEYRLLLYLLHIPRYHGSARYSLLHKVHGMSFFSANAIQPDSYWKRPGSPIAVVVNVSTVGRPIGSSC